MDTTFSATTGGMTVRVLPVKAVISPWVPTVLTSVGSPATASADIPFSCWVQVCSTLTDKPDEVIYILTPQWRI